MLSIQHLGATPMISTRTRTMTTLDPVKTSSIAPTTIPSDPSHVTTAKDPMVRTMVPLPQPTPYVPPSVVPEVNAGLPLVPQVTPSLPPKNIQLPIAQGVPYTPPDPTQPVARNGNWAASNGQTTTDQQTQQDQQQDQNGDEKDTRPWYKKPVVWGVTGGTVAVLGIAVFLLRR